MSEQTQSTETSGASASGSAENAVVNGVSSNDFGHGETTINTGAGSANIAAAQENDAYSMPEELRMEPADAEDSIEPPWYESMSDDVKKNPNVTKYKSPEELARGYIELTRKLGERGPQKLREGATPEEINAFRAIRRGEDIKTPDDYTFEKGNTDEDLVAYKQALFEAGADDYMADSVLRAISSVNERANAQGEASYANEATELKKVWGEDYAVNVRAVQNLANRYPEAMRALQVYGFDKLASVNLMLHDMNVRAGDAQLNFSQARTQTRADRLRAIEKSVAYRDVNHNNHNKAMAERAEIFMQMAQERSAG